MSKKMYRSAIKLGPADSDYSDISRVAEAINSLYARISKKHTPDLIVQISDLSSPGGMVLGSELQRLFDVPPALVTARVESHHADKRSAVEIVGVPSLVNAQILVVDDVIFSGTTIMEAVKKVKVIFPVSKISVACIIIHKACPAIEHLRGYVNDVFFAAETLNREIQFPWGRAEWYGNLVLDFGATALSIEAIKRPWGHYEDYAHNKVCTVRLLSINAYQRLSLQRHKKRDEFFVALDSGIFYFCGDKEVAAVPGDYVFIPRGEWHRIGNKTSSPVRVLEVSFGKYDQVGDIERKEDDYGRVDLDGSI